MLMGRQWPTFSRLLGISQCMRKPSIDGPRRDKTCLQGFRLTEIQSSLLNHRDYLESWNFTWSKFTFNTFQNANNKGADQTARMHVLFANPWRQVSSRRGPLIIPATRDSDYSGLLRMWANEPTVSSCAKQIPFSILVGANADSSGCTNQLRPALAYLSKEIPQWPKQIWYLWL